MRRGKTLFEQLRDALTQEALRQRGQQKQNRPKKERYPNAVPMVEVKPGHWEVQQRP